MQNVARVAEGPLPGIAEATLRSEAGQRIDFKLEGDMSTKGVFKLGVAIIPALTFFTCLPVVAQTANPGATTDSSSTAPESTKGSFAYDGIRASNLIGKDVIGSGKRKIGEVKDLIVNVNTGDVRYALLDFDPGFLSSDKLFAVPLSKLAVSADGKTLSYAGLSREQLKKAGVGRKDWERAVDNRRYIEGLDTNYGFKPPAGTARSFRASELIGKDVESRSGKDIGEIRELVVDVRAAKVRYAVLAFDPGWMTAEKLYAFPLNVFKMTGKDALTLDVDKSMIQSMRNFDASRWSNLNDIERDALVNKTVVNGK